MVGDHLVALERVDHPEIGDRTGQAADIDGRVRRERLLEWPGARAVRICNERTNPDRRRCGRLKADVGPCRPSRRGPVELPVAIEVKKDRLAGQRSLTEGLAAITIKILKDRTASMGENELHRVETRWDRQRSPQQRIGVELMAALESSEQFGAVG